jgi:hypothetical protein
MNWPWRRRGANVAASTELAELDAQRRLRRAHGDTEAIDRRAAELARELPAGELYTRISRVLGRPPREAG